MVNLEINLDLRNMENLRFLKIRSVKLANFDENFLLGCVNLEELEFGECLNSP